MNSIIAVIKKELDRVISDRKLIFSLFVLPILLVIGIMYLSSTLLSDIQNDIDSHVSSVYVENVPDSFLQFVEDSGVNVDIIPLSEEELEEKKQGVMDGEVDLIYVFDPEFETMIEEYQQGDTIPDVTMYYNDSEDYSSNAASIMEVVMSQYQQQLLALRYGSTDAISVFHVTQSELIDEAKASNRVVGQIAPYLISILMFASAMGLVVDAMVGEKERGTLSSMLISPIARQSIVLGKLIGLAILSTCSAAIYGISMILTFPTMVKGMSGESATSLAIHFSVAQIAQLLVIMILMILLDVSAIAIVSILAKNAKEATTYVSPMYILVMVVGMFSMYNTKDGMAAYLYAIPFYGNTLAMQKILSTGLSGVEFLFAAGGLILVIVILIMLLARAFDSEKIMFNA